MDQIIGDIMDDDIFAESIAADDRSNQPAPWKILIVDDNSAIHEATKFALRNEVFRGRGMEFHHAYSGAEALEKFQAIDDLALIFLDVVMETDDAGLNVVRTLRTTYGAQAVRVVLRTGQPGNAPERSVIVDYDINDYKEKTELTSDKLFVTLIAALRAYEDIRTIERLKEYAYERMAMEAELEQNALDQIALPLIYTDTLLSVTRANRAAAGVLGRNVDDIVGFSLFDFANQNAMEILAAWRDSAPQSAPLTLDLAPGLRASVSRFSSHSGEEGGLVIRLGY
jgi:CheY-like chemotaxis protein